MENIELKELIEKTRYNISSLARYIERKADREGGEKINHVTIRSWVNGISKPSIRKFKIFQSALHELGIDIDINIF